MGEPLPKGAFSTAPGNRGGLGTLPTNQLGKKRQNALFVSPRWDASQQYGTTHWKVEKNKNFQFMIFSLIS